MYINKCLQRKNEMLKFPRGVMSSKNVIIIGTKDDYQSVYMHNKLLKFGVKPYIFDTRDFPNSLFFTFDVGSPSGGYIKLQDSDQRLEFDTIVGCYIRAFKGVVYSDDKDPLLREVVYWNNEAALGSFCRVLQCNWVNSLESVVTHRYKPFQLQIMKKNGIKIPETVITNDPEQVLELCNGSEENYIYKPIRGWANTAILNKADMKKERLSSLQYSPITLQQCVKGQDIRVYVVGDEIFPVGIESKDIDSRATRENKHYRIEIPKDIQEMCKKIRDLMGFAYTAIDIKRTEEGEYYVFEANATPIFVNDETDCGYPIGDRICELLIK